MSVGREVQGKVRFKIAPVAVNLFQEAPAHGCTKPFACQMTHPSPRQGTEGYLKRTRPVDATLKRILLEPTPKLGLDLRQGFAVPVKTVVLRQDHEMLMPVQFPNYFVISDARLIKVGNAPKIVCI